MPTLSAALASGDGPGESLPVSAVEVGNAVQTIEAMNDPAHRSKAADRLGQVRTLLKHRETSVGEDKHLVAPLSSFLHRRPQSN